MKTLLSNFLCLALILVSTSAFANSPNLICEQDKRHADGDYSKLEVNFLSGDLAVIYLRRISGGFAPPGVAHSDNFINQKLGKNVECKSRGTEVLNLDCYAVGILKPILFISIKIKDVYGTKFVEVIRNGKSIALFDSSSCETKF